MKYFIHDNSTLSNNVSKKLNTESLPIIIRIFKNHEIDVRIPNLTPGQGVIKVLFQYSHQENPDVFLRKVKTTGSIIKKQGYNPKLYLTFLPYGRSDKEFLSCQGTIFQDVINELLIYYSHMTVLNNHCEIIHKNFTDFNIIPYLLNQSKKDYDLIIGPDKGSYRLVKSLSEEKNIPFVTLEKMRDRVSGEISFKNLPKTKARSVVFVDDMVDGGGTLVNSINALKSGFSKISIVFAHPILNKGLNSLKISETVDEIIFSETISLDFKFPNNVKVVELSSKISELIKD